MQEQTALCSGLTLRGITRQAMHQRASSEFGGLDVLDDANAGIANFKCVGRSSFCLMMNICQDEIETETPEEE